MAQVLRALQDRVGFDVGDVGDLIVGCGAGSGDHASDIARLSALDAGWGPDAPPGVTLNRYCGSGQQAVNSAAQAIASGHEEVVLAGGVESMSRYAPTHAEGMHANNWHLFELHPMVHQGIAADLIATLGPFSRAECDEFAFSSQQRAAAAMAEDRFGRSIVPISDEDGTVVLDRDEHPRPATTLDDLANLRPSFAALGATVDEGYTKSYDDYCRDVYPQLDAVDHVHHAGNSSGVV